MKTLDQIEPRPPVAGPHLTITQPGSCHLTVNIKVSSGNSIFVSANNVTIDLNGFTIAGVANPASSTSGIRIFEANNVTVRNGTIADIGYGIQASGTDTNSYGHRFEKLNLTRCYTYGIRFSNISDVSLVISCTFSRIGNNSPGLTPIAIADSNGGIRVENCTIGDVSSVVAADPTTGISGSPGSFYINNSIANCKIGIFRGKYKDNLFSNCATTVASGTDAGGNN